MHVVGHQNERDEATRTTSHRPVYALAEKLAGSVIGEQSSLVMTRKC